MNILGSGSSHMQGSMRMRAPAASAAAANARCQKCQQQGHWTYECNQDYLYKSRPTRTQQLLDPKYRPKFMDAREVLPEDQPAQAEPAKAPRKRRRHQSDSSSSDSDSSSSSDSGSSSSSDSDSSSSSDGSTSSGSTSSSGSDSSSSSGSSSSDASSSESSSDSEEDKPPCRTRKRLPEYPAKEPRQNGMQDSDRQHYARHKRGSDRRMPSASRRATEHYNDEAAYRGDSRRADYERHRQSERRSVDRHVRPDLERQDTRRRIASKISVPDTYTAARQEPHSHATDISREQPFGDRWNGRYEPINGSHAHHEERAHQGRSRQQNRAASGSSDYTGSSGDTGSSASSGRS